MVAITVSNGQVTVGSSIYNSLKYKAFLDTEINGVIIKSYPVGGDIIYQGADYSVLTLNGASYASNVAFVQAFNDAVKAGDLGVSDSKNISYPDTLISSVITATTKQQISTVAKPGYVTFSAPSGNTGVIYIDLTGVSASSFALAAGQSVGLEFVDLSLVYVLASVGGETVCVLGAYKS